VVKALKGIIHTRKTISVVYIVLSNVTEIEEGAHGLHHLIWYVAFNCG
jgi:hypothetical protein